MWSADPLLSQSPGANILQELKEYAQREREKLESERRATEREKRECEKLWVDMGEQTDRLRAAEAEVTQQRRELDLERLFLSKAHMEASSDKDQAANDKTDVQRVWLKVSPALCHN